MPAELFTPSVQHALEVAGIFVFAISGALLAVRKNFDVFGMAVLAEATQPGTSKHLRVLREAGLARVRRDAQRRWYELRPEPLAEVDAWLAPYRRLWTDRLDALERHLDTMPEFPEATGEPGARDARDARDAPPDAPDGEAP